jgi:hypothetical protein
MADDVKPVITAGALADKLRQMEPDAKVEVYTYGSKVTLISNGEIVLEREA